MATSTGDIRDAARKTGDDAAKAAREVQQDVVGSVRESARHAKEQALNTADQARTSLASNYEQLKRDVDVLRGQLVALGADATDEAKLRLSQGLDKLGRRADALSHDAQIYGGRKLEEAERLVQERPLTSVLVSFGLGMLFAQFMRR